MKGYQWSSRIGLVFAAAGSAIGLGNFLRFPGVAYLNGGGSFLVPYIICFFLVAIPLYWVEWSLGKMGGSQGKHSAFGIFSVFVKNRFLRSVISALAILVPVGVYFYYALIQSWCLGYFLYYLGFIDFPNIKDTATASQFFDLITKRNQSGFALSISFYILIATLTLNFLIIFFGFIKTIEKFCLLAIPLMAVCAFAILVRVLTLGTVDESMPERNVWNALGFMWNPRGLSGDESWIQNLLSPQVWLAAFGQVFFSVSIGFGILIHYASFVKKEDDIALSSLGTASTNGFFEVCVGGLLTIPVIYLFLGENFRADSSFSLGFISMPLVFNQMFMGDFFGLVWFLMLFLAAITSSVSMISPFVSFIEDYFKLSQTASKIVAVVFLSIGNFMVYIFSENLSLLSTLDFWVGTVCIFLLSGLMLLSGLKYLGVDKIIETLKEGSLIDIPRVVKPLLSFIAPSFFVVIFVGWVVRVLPNQMSGYFSSFESALGVFLSVFLFILLFLLSYTYSDER